EIVTATSSRMTLHATTTLTLAGLRLLGKSRSSSPSGWYPDWRRASTTGESRCGGALAKTSPAASEHDRTRLSPIALGPLVDDVDVHDQMQHSQRTSASADARLLR